MSKNLTNKKYLLLFATILVAGVMFRFLVSYDSNFSDKIGSVVNPFYQENDGGPEPIPHPLSIEALRQGEYPGSEMKIEQTLNPASNYQRYIASYKSEGLKIYGLLTIPNGDPSTNAQDDGKGYPVIIFNHGYISPAIYKTTEKYVTYQDAFARAGYVTFKSDYRGHGNSEGRPSGGYGSNGYTIDVLNAVSSIKKLKDPSNVNRQMSLRAEGSQEPEAIVNSKSIGMWGHSMGGHITLETMVVNPDIKAGIIWAGVVGSYEDLFERWRRIRSGPTPTPNPSSQRGRWRQELADVFGDPSENPEFWKSLSATSYLEDISGPIQLHHGTADSSVPLEFSENLDKLLKDAGKAVELYTYNGDDHNLSQNLSLALSRSVEFFDRYLK